MVAYNYEQPVSKCTCKLQQKAVLNLSLAFVHCFLLISNNSTSWVFRVLSSTCQRQNMNQKDNMQPILCIKHTSRWSNLQFLLPMLLRQALRKFVRCTDFFLRLPSYYPLVNEHIPMFNGKYISNPGQFPASCVS